jgi:hypothetical protein
LNIKQPIIYQKQTKNTYLYFIKENFTLIKNLLEEEKKVSPYTSDEKSGEHKIFYQRKAKFIQAMILIGINAEHILKIILLKNGFIINEGVFVFKEKYSDSFLKNLDIYNKNENNKSQENLDFLYEKASIEIKRGYKINTISFDKCIKLFKKIIKDNKNYYNSIGKYPLNPPPKKINVDGMLLDAYYGPEQDYFGYKEITPNNVLDIIRIMRNNYIHFVDAHEEQQGLVCYLYNFLLYLCVKEFKNYFKEEKYLYEEKIKVQKLFPTIEKI